MKNSLTRYHNKWARPRAGGDSSGSRLCRFGRNPFGEKGVPWLSCTASEAGRDLAWDPRKASAKRIALERRYVHVAWYIYMSYDESTMRKTMERRWCMMRMDDNASMMRLILTFQISARAGTLAAGASYTVPSAFLSRTKAGSLNVPRRHGRKWRSRLRSAETASAMQRSGDKLSNLKQSVKKNDFSTVLGVVLILRGFHISSVSFSTHLAMFAVIETH